MRLNGFDAPVSDFCCENKVVTRAFYLAKARIQANICLMNKGLMKTETYCLMAGLDYDSPWTRDASINVWFSAPLLDTALAANTLLSGLEKTDAGVMIGGQYWDRIVWSLGAYRYWKLTGDSEWLRFAYEAISNTIRLCEKEEQDPEDGLFYGAAVYGDGVSAYPPRYRNPDLSSGIIRWPSLHKKEARVIGGGLPTKTLYLNCVYAETYRILYEMSCVLGITDQSWHRHEEQLKLSINRFFWNENKGSYDYLLNESDAQDSLGLAFALLFDIADDRQAASVLKVSIPPSTVFHVCGLLLLPIMMIMIPIDVIAEQYGRIYRVLGRLQPFIAVTGTFL